jgi:hypothetical protein
MIKGTAREVTLFFSGMVVDKEWWMILGQQI